MENNIDKPKFWLFVYTKGGTNNYYTLAFCDSTIEGARASFNSFVKPKSGDSWQEFRITGISQEGCHNA